MMNLLLLLQLLLQLLLLLGMSTHVLTQEINADADELIDAAIIRDVGKPSPLPEYSSPVHPVEESLRMSALPPLRDRSDTVELASYGANAVIAPISKSEKDARVSRDGVASSQQLGVQGDASVGQPDDSDSSREDMDGSVDGSNSAIHDDNSAEFNGGDSAVSGNTDDALYGWPSGKDDRIHENSVVRELSTLCGWMYTICWCSAFLPQILMNRRRHSVLGMSLDFLAFNVTGYLAYTIYNIALFSAGAEILEYEHEVDASSAPKGLPKLNDIVFSLNGLLMQVIVIVQVIKYKTDKQSVSSVATQMLRGIYGGVFLLLLFVLIGAFPWFMILKVLGSIKIIMTLSKYYPQARLNYMRKSTLGWSIKGSILDFIGGLLSILQMMLDAYAAKSWGELTNNTPKLMLGLLSIVFTLIFMYQHFVLYGARSAAARSTLNSLRKHRVRASL